MDHERPKLKKLVFSGTSDAKQSSESAPEIQSKSNEPILASATSVHSWPAVKTPVHLDLIKSHSSGVLKFSPEISYEFTAEDLLDLGEIGQGCFGSVYKMLHKSSQMLIAVKGDCLICMELMDISLERLYKSVFEKLKEKVPEEIIGKLAVSILKALSYLKELKVIHRDVKPSNILLNTQGNIKLCDFGIAGQLVDSIAKSRDVGCKPYMAPERIDPKRNSGYDVRSDVWSFGITLVEVATAQFPYPEWTSMFDQLQSVVKGDPPILTPTDHPYFTLDFIRFVNSCLTKDLEKRPKYPELMETPFFKKYEKSTVDVGGYVKEMLDRLSNNT